LHALILLIFLITFVQVQSLPSTSEAERETGGEEEVVSTLPRSK
jgi:hypothetical protein